MATALPSPDQPARPRSYDRMIESGVIHKCEGCGRFCSDDDFYGDHERQGCEDRSTDHGLDRCGCYLAPFCSEACANRWHGKVSR